MGRRQQILTQVLGFDGFKADGRFERASGEVLAETALPSEFRGATLVLTVQRRWLPRCSSCGAVCRKVHEQLATRRWRDLPWAEHPVVIEYAPIRVRCHSCKATPVELLPWADRSQRQTKRLQHHMAVQSAWMPISHVAALNGVDWDTVRRAEDAALQRWERTRPDAALFCVGVDEKYLGRRGRWPERFVTIVSNLDTGEPIWIGFGRSEATLTTWLSTLTKEEKAKIQTFAMDMFAAFTNAVRADPDLQHVAIVHAPFHIMKRAGQAVDEVRREVLFRGGPELRALGRGKRWLFLKASHRLDDEERETIASLLSGNRRLMLAYTVKEQLRDVLREPTGEALAAGLKGLLRRIARRQNVPMRKLHDCLQRHFDAIVALGQHRPPTGRIEALNNNWETLARRGRGYRDLTRMLRRLRFMTAHPLRQGGVKRFLALAATPPFPIKQAA